MRCLVEIFTSVRWLFLSAAVQVFLGAAVQAQFDFDMYTMGTSPQTALGQTSLADVDGDGDLDFLDGSKDSGEAYWWEYHSASHWDFHLIGVDLDGGEQVGGTAVDVNRDGKVDFLATGSWFEQPGNPASLWIKHPYNGLSGAHDVVVVDLDGNGSLETIQMFDKSPQLKIVGIPTSPENLHWPEQNLGTPVHAGLTWMGMGMWTWSAQEPGTKTRTDWGPVGPL